MLKIDLINQPYASLDESEAKELQEDWNAGKYSRVISTIGFEIATHKRCGNYIKAGHLVNLRKKLRIASK